MLGFKSGTIFLQSAYDAKFEVELQRCAGQAEWEGRLFRPRSRLYAIWYVDLVGDECDGTASGQRWRILGRDHAAGIVGVTGPAHGKTETIRHRGPGGKNHRYLHWSGSDVSTPRRTEYGRSGAQEI